MPIEILSPDLDGTGFATSRSSSARPPGARRRSRRRRGSTRAAPSSTCSPSCRFFSTGASCSGSAAVGKGDSTPRRNGSRFRPPRTRSRPDRPARRSSPGPTTAFRSSWSRRKGRARARAADRRDVAPLRQPFVHSEQRACPRPRRRQRSGAARPGRARPRGLSRLAVGPRRLARRRARDADRFLAPRRASRAPARARSGRTRRKQKRTRSAAAKRRAGLARDRAAAVGRPRRRPAAGSRLSRPAVQRTPAGAAESRRRRLRTARSIRSPTPSWPARLVWRRSERRRCGREVVWVGELDGAAGAELVTSEEIPNEKDTMRAELDEARRPRARVRVHALDSRGIWDPVPRSTFEIEGYAFEGGGSDEDDPGDTGDGFGFELPTGVRDLDGDGRLDIVAIRLDFSLFEAMRVLTTHSIKIGLDFGIYRQGDGNVVRAGAGPRPLRRAQAPPGRRLDRPALVVRRRLRRRRARRLRAARARPQGHHPPRRGRRAVRARKPTSR